VKKHECFEEYQIFRKIGENPDLEKQKSHKFFPFSGQTKTPTPMLTHDHVVPLKLGTLGPGPCRGKGTFGKVWEDELWGGRGNLGVNLPDSIGN